MSDAMVFISIREQTSQMAAAMKILLRKRQKVKKSNATTFQSDMTETEFSEGEGLIYQQCCRVVSLLFLILSSSVFQCLRQMMANTEWKYFLPKFLLAHPEKHIQNLLSVIFSIIQKQNIF